MPREEGFDGSHFEARDAEVATGIDVHRLFGAAEGIPEVEAGLGVINPSSHWKRNSGDRDLRGLGRNGSRSPPTPNNPNAAAEMRGSSATNGTPWCVPIDTPQ